MPDAQQQSPLIDLGQMVPDPTAMSGAVQAQWQHALESAPDWATRIQIMGQMGGQMLAGGDPRVREASQQRQAMQNILQQVNDAAPDDEDQLDYQQRLSTAMLHGMASINPQVALAASQNLLKIQEARQQRSLIQADTSLTQDKAQLADTQAKIDKAVGGRIVFVKPGLPDGNGVALPTAVATLDVNDPNFSQQAAQLQADAQKGGYQLVPRTPDQFENDRLQTTIARGQLALKAAQLRAQATLQAAAIRAAQSGQHMDGRSFQMASRVLSGAEMAGAAVQNVANMEFGATSGFLGHFGHEGGSMFDGASDSLRNKLTPQEQQEYENLAQPIYRGVSAIESQGGLQGGQQLAAGIERRLEIHPGDTPLTIMTKLAEVRQDIQQGTKVQLLNPALPPAIRQQVQDSINQLIQAIPFTVADVQAFQRSQEKNPGLTYRQWAAKNNIGQTASTPNPQPGAPDSAGGPGGTVRVKSPDGRTGTIPAANLQKALAAGYMQVK